jgi:RNA polymerase sigma-70 factor (ECF subfamily)
MRNADDHEKSLSFDQVYELYSARVYAYCLLHVRSTALAEDLAADTMVAAFRAYERVQPPPDEARIWLFRIARNQIIDHFRREKRRGTILQIFGRSQERTGDVEQIAETNADLSRAMELLAGMKSKDRLIIGLRVGGRLSNREIGEVLGVSENTAAGALHRAFERFKRLSREQP